MQSTYNVKGVRMQAQFRRVCKAMGWDCDSEAWSRVDPNNKNIALRANVGHTWIQRGPNPMRTYYRVVQMTSGSGGEQTLSDNYTARELSAWFDGILKAQETLCKLHSDMVRSVDSGRGNETFAAHAIERSL